jgi:hypothetical protein
MRGAVILTAATVAGGCKNAQIYFFKQDKKMCSGKLHSEDVVSGNE